MACIIWRFSDDKAGHDAQSQGLEQALGRLIAIKSFTCPVPAPMRRWRILFKHLPAPDLIIGAGHATHLPMLLARWQRGGRIIVLMRPSLPLRLFDLCIIPEHDGIKPSPGVLLTTGPVNKMATREQKNPQLGLFLLGGPSRHFGWDDQNILNQIEHIARSSNNGYWLLTTSRRTPKSMLAVLNDLPDNIAVHTETAPDWLPEQLSQAQQAWVTADSMAMIFEALSAGAKVGLLSLPVRKQSKISLYIEQLAKQNWVTSYAKWDQDRHLTAPPHRLQEADRCAQWILTNCLSKRG